MRLLLLLLTRSNFNAGSLSTRLERGTRMMFLKRHALLLLCLFQWASAVSSSSDNLFAFDLSPPRLAPSDGNSLEQCRPSRARIEDMLCVEHGWNVVDEDLDLDVVPSTNSFYANDDDSSEPNIITRTLSSGVSLHVSATDTKLKTRQDYYSANNHDEIIQRFKKTGTTIAGCCVNNHVILAADTRATEATIVADKRCQKLHQLAQNSWCCGAGTSADLDHLTKQCLYSMALQRLHHHSVGNEGSMDNPPLLCGPQTDIDDDEEEDESSHHLLIGSVSIEALCHFLRQALYDAKGNLGANLILGGVWKGKAHLRAIHPHGSMDVDLPFAALGSGGLAAMGVLERGFRSNDMTVEEGIELVQNAILAGIRNDLGSGSQVDLCVIYPDGTSRFQRHAVPEEELDTSDEEPSTAAAKARTTGGKALGVNGFGNLPFAVQAKKVLFVSTEAKEKERLSQWDRVLGISKKDENDKDKS